MLVRGGKARVLRRFTNGDYVYTALGKKHFEKHQTQFLAHVPRAHQEERQQQRRTALPGAPQRLYGGSSSAHTFHAHGTERILKERVLHHMEQLDKTADGVPILYEDSDPVCYGEDGEWTFDAQTVVETDGEMRTTAVMDRSLGACPLLPASMYGPEGLCSESARRSPRPLHPSAAVEAARNSIRGDRERNRHVPPPRVARHRCAHARGSNDSWEARYASVRDAQRTQD